MPEKVTLRNLDKRLNLIEAKQSRMEIASQLVIPSVSLIVATIGAFTAWNAYRLSESAFDLHVDPIVIASVTVARGSNQCTLMIENQGVNPVFDVRIKKHHAVIDLVSKRLLGQLHSATIWKYVSRLEPRDSVVFLIDHEELGRVLHQSRIHARFFQSDTMSLLPLVVFYTTFRRMPDKRIYRIRTPLYVLENARDSTAIPATDQDPFTQRFADLGAIMDSAFVRP